MRSWLTEFCPIEDASELSESKTAFQTSAEFWMFPLWRMSSSGDLCTATGLQTILSAMENSRAIQQFNDSVWWYLNVVPLVRHWKL